MHRLNRALNCESVQIHVMFVRAHVELKIVCPMHVCY